MNIQILLADDHQIMRNGLCALIDQRDDMEVVGEAADGRTALRLVQILEPHVVIMDIGMPDLNGIEATCQIRAKYPQVKVIALSMHSDKRFVAGMLHAGAVGYLLKDCAFEELARAVHRVMEHKTYLSPAISGVELEEYFATSPAKESSSSPDAPGELS